jgi:hypothetical protein
MAHTLACPECGNADHIYALEGPDLRFDPASGLWKLTSSESDLCECTECDAQFMALDIGLPDPEAAESALVAQLARMTATDDADAPSDPRQLENDAALDGLIGRARKIVES